MKVKYGELEDAFLFSDAGVLSEAESYLSKESGEFYFISDYIDEEVVIPDDLDDADKYLLVPTRQDLVLAHPRDFVLDKMPEQINKLDQIFSRKGAYRRFKDWLIRINKIDAWYEYEDKARREALEKWCEESNITLID